MTRRTAKTDNSTVVAEPKTKIPRLKYDDLKQFNPLTDNQRKFFEAYKRGDYFIALHGVAGTGKTFCAMYKAIQEVLEKGSSFNKIIVVRSAVQSTR